MRRGEYGDSSVNIVPILSVVGVVLGVHVECLVVDVWAWVEEH